VHIYTPASFGIGTDEECEAADAQYDAALKAYTAYLKRFTRSSEPSLRRFLKLHFHDADLVSFVRVKHAHHIRFKLDTTSAYTKHKHRFVDVTLLGAGDWTGTEPKPNDVWLYEVFEKLESQRIRLSLVFWRPRGLYRARHKLCEFEFRNVVIRQTKPTRRAKRLEES
jgi:hypothetical protein